MAHGTPSIQFCYKCNAYALVPRFEEKNCSFCKKQTNTITENELKRKLEMPITDTITLNFKWHKL